MSRVTIELDPFGLKVAGIRRHNGLHAIAGCMYSGKSQELIRILSLWRHTGAAIEAYTHIDSAQKSDDKIRSRSGATFPTQTIESLADIKDSDTGFQRVIAIDEAQFFDEDHASYVAHLARRNLVIIAGLDMNFRGEPYGIMAPLLAMADHVTKLKAVCASCKLPNATMTQRLVNGKPAPYDSPVHLPGDADFYEPRCRHCHEIGERE